MNTDRFKFRVWENARNCYLKDEKTAIVGDGDLIYGDMITNAMQLAYGADNSNIIVEQCTGLKDKNGNLIYEADVVYDSVYENNFVVSWDNDRTGYVLSANNTNHIDYLSKILIERHNLKIIGNIHEQKENQ